VTIMSEKLGDWIMAQFHMTIIITCIRPFATCCAANFCYCLLFMPLWMCIYLAPTTSQKDENFPRNWAACKTIKMLVYLGAFGHWFHIIACSNEGGNGRRRSPFSHIHAHKDPTRLETYSHINYPKNSINSQSKANL
jgi:hypothetical protein